MAVKFTNNARTTLAADITNSATTATVTSGAVFPELNAGEYFYCTFDNGTNNEIVKVTARSGNTLTIVRGVDNSTARAFVADDAAELRATAGLLTDIQENLAAKSANQTIYNATTASNATAYDIGIDPGQESNAMVFLNGVMQHHDTFSFSSSTLTFDTAPVNGTALEVIVDNLINLQSSNLTTDTFTATSGQTAFVLSDAPAAENNLIVFIDGVFQDQSNYSISDHTLTLATGAVQGRTVTIYIINPVNIGTPSDGTVTTSKLSGNITMPGTLTVGAFDVAFDSPTFFVDNSNSRVGLGTATPSVPVDIVGEVKISSHLTLGTTSKVQFGDSGTYIHQSADGVLDLVSDTEIEINATTIDVNGALDVSGAITGTLATAAQTNITSVGSLTALTGGTGDLNWDSGTLFVDSSANSVGIGTTSPDSNVQIANNNGSSYRFGYAGTSDVYLDADNVYFRTDGGANTAIVTTTGVGIGTTSPTQGKLVVSGAAYNEGILIERTDTSSRWGLSGDSSGSFQIWDDNQGDSTRFVIDSSGNMIIGGASVLGGAKLSIDHSGAAIIGADTSSSGGGYIQLLASDSSKGLLGFGSNSGASSINNVALRSQSGDIEFHTSGATERMRINASGNISLACTSDYKTLTVGDTDAEAWITSGGSNTHLTISANGSSGAVIFRTGGTNGDPSATTERFRVQPNGNVSIGGTASGGTPNLQFYHNDSLRAYLRATDAAGLLIDSDSAITFNTNNTARWIMGSSGHITPNNQHAYDIGGTNAEVRNILALTASFGGALASGRNLHVHGITRLQVAPTSNYPVVEIFNGNGNVGNIRTSGSATAYDTSSDYRLKENVEPIQNGLQRLKQLNPVQFDWKVDGTTSEGFIAHEVQEIFPDAVGGEKDGEEMQGMDYGRITPLLVKAIQEQQAQIEILKTEIQELKDNG